MRSDIEIAQAAEMLPISEIAREIGVDADDRSQRRLRGCAWDTRRQTLLCCRKI